MAYVKCLMNVVSSTIPDGKTVTPTDDVSILLACAGRTETYTTISALLADATALAGVISSNNAIDYLVRSTTWASDVCGDSGAMSYIGLNNYASNTLLADSTWNEAIQNSTYFESVDNVKAPVMTSDNTPSGTCFSYPSAASGYEAYKAFDGNDSTFYWSSSIPSIGDTVGYQFPSAVKCFKCDYYDTGGASSIDIEGFYDSEWHKLKTNVPVISAKATVDFVSEHSCEYYRIMINTVGSTLNNYGVFTLQFYGRADV